MALFLGLGGSGSALLGALLPLSADIRATFFTFAVLFALMGLLSLGAAMRMRW